MSHASRSCLSIISSSAPHEEGPRAPRRPRAHNQGIRTGKSPRTHRKAQPTGLISSSLPRGKRRRPSEPSRQETSQPGNQDRGKPANPQEGTADKLNQLESSTAPAQKLHLTTEGQPTELTQITSRHWTKNDISIEMHTDERRNSAAYARLWNLIKF